MKMMHRRAISIVTAFGVIISCAFSRPLIKSVSAAETSNDETSSEETVDEELPGLDIVQTYNLICFDDYVNNNSDVKGPSAIGGNIKASEITFGNVNEMPKSNNYGLVAGKTDPDNITITQGHSDTKAFVYSGVKAKFTDPSNKLFDGVDTWNTSDSFKQKVQFDFGTLQKTLKTTSEIIANITSNCDKPVADGSNVLIFTGKDQDCNIFTVNAETLNKYAFFRIDAPDGATNVINVSGKKVMLPTINDLSDNKKKLLLWNLSEADTVSNQNSNSIEGSVLAPNAEFLPMGSSNYEGTLIVNSFNTSNLVAANGQKLGFEGHFYPFMGKFPPKCFKIDLLVNKTAAVDSWDDRTYKLTLDVTATKDLPGFVAGVNITDIIDSNFQLTEESQRELNKKAKITRNADGTTKVVWKKQFITILKKWERTLEVQAKPGFIGGNNIPTNAVSSGKDKSGVTYGKCQFKPFTTPYVNVKPNLTVENASATIFRGESVPTGPANSCKTWDDSRVNFQWYRLDGGNKEIPLTGVGKNVDFPNNLTPDTDTTYVLHASFDCSEPTNESNGNTHGFKAGDEQDGYVFTTKDGGYYNVKVVSGELDITKIMDAQYPAPEGVDPHQSFVFKITRSDPKPNCPPETFYEVITPSDAKKGETKKITGLKKGIYTITEETGGTTGAWRYVDWQEITNTNSPINKIGAAASIGLGTPPNEVYLGGEKNTASVTFINHLSNFQWFGDTTVKVNTITNP